MTQYTVTSADYRNVFPRIVGTYETPGLAMDMALIASIADSKPGYSGTAHITDANGISVGCYMNGKKVYCHLSRREA